MKIKKERRHVGDKVGKKEHDIPTSKDVAGGGRIMQRQESCSDLMDYAFVRSNVVLNPTGNLQKNLRVDVNNHSPSNQTI